MPQHIPFTTDLQDLSQSERMIYHLMTDGRARLTLGQRALADEYKGRYPEICEHSIQDALLHGIDPEPKIVETLLAAGHTKEELTRRQSTTHKINKTKI